MSLTLDEARARAAALGDVSYGVDLDLRDPAAGTFGSRTTVRFTTTAPDTFLEVTAATDLVVTLDGRSVDPEAAYDGKRLRLSGLADGAHEVVVDARLPYVTDGDGMHTFTDPADGATYVSAYVGMDIAQRVLACFDQNDLKAPVTLSVTADPAWTVLGNGRVTGHDVAAGTWTFATTPPIPTAMFVVCAGPWHSRTWEHAGLPFGWHARRSLAADLDRDFDELRATTEACFDHYAELFDEPYPFDSFDQAFVPGHNWGALETPGCVTYRDEYLPRGRTHERMRSSRTTTIAHEMCHMWFGDLVTMTWWEDTWLQESFADYMGYRVAADAVGRTDVAVTREVGRKSTGYDADQRRSTHPVAPHAEEVPDVDAAATNFDMISYAKGNAALHQLVTWLGDEVFLAGVNAYLTRHRFGNATLADFVTALDDASDRDVRGWVEVWLRQSGFDTIRVAREGGADGPGTAVLTRDGVRPHTIRVTTYDGASMTETGSRLVDLGDEPVRLDDVAADAVVVPNSHGETFARVELDPRSWSAVAGGLARIEDPLVRAVLWGNAFQLARARTITALELVDLVARQLPGERDAMLTTIVIGRTLGAVVPQRLAAADVPTVWEDLASACATGLAHATDADHAQAFAEGYAATTRDADALLGWLDTDQVPGGGAAGLPLTPTMRWSVVRRLAQLGAADAGFVEVERRRDTSVEGELGAARALAARPTREAKEVAWAAAADPDVSNRRFEAVLGGLWAPEQADLLAPYVDRYLDQAPTWAARSQAYAQVVGNQFPAIPLTTEQVDALEAALAARDDLSTVLRRKWDDRLDDLR